MYILKDKETNEIIELSATTKREVLIEVLDILGYALDQRATQIQPRLCIVCKTEFTPIDRRFLKCDNCRSSVKQGKIEHTQKCWTCGQDFTTTDGRIRNCPDCRLKSREKPELQRECAHCTREFITTDKRVKHCPQCITRDFFVRYNGAEKIVCRACDGETCLEQEKPKTCTEIWHELSKKT